MDKSNNKARNTSATTIWLVGELTSHPTPSLSFSRRIAPAIHYTSQKNGRRLLSVSETWTLLKDRHKSGDFKYLELFSFLLEDIERALDGTPRATVSAQLVDTILQLFYYKLCNLNVKYANFKYFGVSFEGPASLIYDVIDGEDWQSLLFESHVSERSPTFRTHRFCYKTDRDGCFTEITLAPYELEPDNLWWLAAIRGALGDHL